MARETRGKKANNTIDDHPMPEAVASTSNSRIPKDKGNEKNRHKSSSEWTKTESEKLFNRICEACPEDDSMKYESRVNNIDWEKIKINGRTAEECKQRWLFVQGHLRHYRLLTELAKDAISWLEHPWFNFNKGRKKINKRHPDKPKKPLTSYTIFCREQKDCIKRQHPELKMGEVSKILAEMFHELGERSRQRYSKLAEEEKKLYDEKMKKFREEYPDYAKAKFRRRIDKNGPPKIPTPFSLFYDEMADNLPKKLSPAEARKFCRKAYKELDDEKKLRWIYKALKKNPEYLDQLNMYSKDHPDFEISAKRLKLLTEEETAIKDKNEMEFAKRPKSGFQIFSTKILESGVLGDLGNRERLAAISHMWKELGEKKQSVFNDRAQKLNKTDSSTVNNAKRKTHKNIKAGSKKQAVSRKEETNFEVGNKKMKQAIEEEEISASSSEDDDLMNCKEHTNSDEIANKKKMHSVENADTSDSSSEEESYLMENSLNSKRELQNANVVDKEKLTVDDDSSSYFSTTSDSVAVPSLKRKRKINNQNVVGKQQKMPAVEDDSTSELSSFESENLASLNLSKNAIQSPSNREKSQVESPITTLPSTIEFQSRVNFGKNGPKNLPSKSKSSVKTLPSQIKALEAFRHAPCWIINEQLYDKEPRRPAESPAWHYALVDSSLSRKSLTELTPKQVEVTWAMLSAKQQQTVSKELLWIKRKYEADFEKFVKNMSEEERGKFQDFARIREKKALSGANKAIFHNEQDPESASGSPNESALDDEGVEEGAADLTDVSESISDDDASDL